MSDSARLTWGVAGNRAEGWRHGLGDRLLWWPYGAPRGKKVGIASSRLGRRWDLRKLWFRALQSACRQIDRPSECLVTAKGTAPAVILARAAYLFGLSVAMLTAPRDDDTIQRWLTRQRQRRTPAQRDSTFPVWISPRFDPDGSDDGRDPCDAPIPVRDRAVVAISDRLHALLLRPEGNLHRLVRARCRESKPAVIIASGDGLTPVDIATELVALGALRVTVPVPRGGFRREPRAKTERATRIVDLPPCPDASHLTHWTRACSGPWPDETMESYLDQLILEPEQVDHSAEATLRRIVRQQKILATSRAIRGAIRTVSFTSIPLSQLREMRVFRPHRGRWDFEPYGISIRRSWLEARGVRPVLYANATDWEDVAEGDRPFYQRRTTSSAGGTPAIDWSLECEWRMVGDVDLACLGPDDGLLFVATQPEAERLAWISPWPIVVLNKPEQFPN